VNNACAEKLGRVPFVTQRRAQHPSPGARHDDEDSELFGEEKTLTTPRPLLSGKPDKRVYGFPDKSKSCIDNEYPSTILVTGYVLFVVTKKYLRRPSP
jgi:hypothetical protein